MREYDPMTRRARVQPAVDLLFTDGSSTPKPVILDVPVLFPGGGGFTLHFPLVAGDAVMLMFSERDIQAFKETLAIGPPLSADIMEIQHAVALPVFPPEDLVIQGDGVFLQSNDRETYVNLDAGTLDATVDGGVTTVHVEAGVIRATPDMGVTQVELTPAAATITAMTVTLDGNLVVTGTSTLRGNTDVTGNIGVTGTVDGVDVSSHQHGSGSLSQTVPPGAGVFGNTDSPN